MCLMCDITGRDHFHIGPEDYQDEISLPQDAVQTNSDDLYLYYAMNDVEINVSTDLMII